MRRLPFLQNSVEAIKEFAAILSGFRRNFHVEKCAGNFLIFSVPTLAKAARSALLALVFNRIADLNVLCAPLIKV